MLAIRQRAQQKRDAARAAAGGEFCGVEDDADFWPSDVTAAQRQ